MLKLSAPVLALPSAVAEDQKPDGVRALKRPRPVPGTITVSEIKSRVCAHCGYLIDEWGLCDYSCPYNNERRTAQDVIVAVYRVTHEFLRDEADDAALELPRVEVGR